VVGQQNTDIANTLQLRDLATATIFWLSVYGVHVGATWRIRLNRPCAAAMRTYVKLLWPLVIIRPHRSTTYIDAACCYRPSSVVCPSVGHRLSVCRYVTLVSPAKTAEPIEMPFGLWARLGPMNYVLEGVQIPMGRGNFGEKVAHCIL